MLQVAGQALDCDVYLRKGEAYVRCGTGAGPNRIVLVIRGAGCIDGLDGKQTFPLVLNELEAISCLL